MQVEFQIEKKDDVEFSGTRCVIMIQRQISECVSNGKFHLRHYATVHWTWVQRDLVFLGSALISLSPLIELTPLIAISAN